MKSLLSHAVSRGNRRESWLSNALSGKLATVESEGEDMFIKSLPEFDTVFREIGLERGAKELRLASHPPIGSGFPASLTWLE
jgi:hypothetical protein